MNTDYRPNDYHVNTDNTPNKTDKLEYYSNKYRLSIEQVKAALASIGNNERLLEGFLRKNGGLQGHR